MSNNTKTHQIPKMSQLTPKWNANENLDNFSSDSKSGANFLLDALSVEGITHFFMVPGKLINPIMSCYDTSHKDGELIIPIIAASEAGAAYMADGYARASKGIGVCVTIDGPGAVNTVGALACAHQDNIPVLSIAGRIPKMFEMTGAIQDSTQTGFNFLQLMEPVTESSLEVKDISFLPRFLRHSITSAYSHHKPSYLSIPKDILLEEVNSQYHKIPLNIQYPDTIDLTAINRLVTQYLSSSAKICILAGAGACQPDIEPVLCEFAETHSIPIATTISSKSLISDNHRCSVGMYGYAGHQRAIETLHSNEVEVLILLGLDVTQWTTLAWSEELLNDKVVIQVDQIPTNHNRYFTANENVIASPKAFLLTLQKVFSKIPPEERNRNMLTRLEWIKKVSKRSKFYDLQNVYSESTPIHPARFIRELRENMPSNTNMIVDSGTHRAFTAHYWECFSTNSFFTATTLAPMGWAIPASIGIATAHQNRTCVVVTGDGCMLMQGLEIQTAARHNIKIIFIVLNNSYYGATYFNNRNNLKRLSALPTHDWAKLAKSLGLNATTISKPEQIKAAIHAALESETSFLIDVRCAHDVETPAHLYRKKLKQYGTM